MSRLVVRCLFALARRLRRRSSPDLEHPLGVGGPEMFDWFFQTRTWRSQHGQPGGETGVDDDVASRAFDGIGAWILGRNMFGPVRGPWPDESGEAGGARSRRTTRRSSC